MTDGAKGPFIKYVRGEAGKGGGGGGGFWRGGVMSKFSAARRIGKTLY